MADNFMQSAAYQAFRAYWKSIWEPANAPCGICGQRTIEWDAPKNTPNAFELDHKISRKKRPDLALDPANAQPSHHRCNRGKSSGSQRPDIGERTEEW